MLTLNVMRNQTIQDIVILIPQPTL